MSHDPAVGFDSESLLSRAAEVGARQSTQVENFHGFLSRYYRHVGTDDLAPDPVDVAGAALSHRHMASVRAPGSSVVRVFNPAVEDSGWTSPHTVVELVTDDMPFLVDSVMAELSRQDEAIHLVIHPLIVVRRDMAGKLLEILDSDPIAPAERGDSADETSHAFESVPRDAITESWIHIEIDRVSSPGRHEELAVALRRILEDVRVAVEDWTKMGSTARTLADELHASPPPSVEPQETQEAVEFLRWLSHGSFTFLGYREYRLKPVQATQGVDDQLEAVPGTGLGVLRHDQRGSSGFERLSPAGRALAREPHILVLTKANSRSTVHRPAYLDYVGVKLFSETGEVIGERRFLGLYTARTYASSVLDIPVVASKVNQVLERADVSHESHSGKDLMQILQTYPRDELFDITAEDLYRIAVAVMYLQERRKTRLFLRYDTYGRFVSALVYLPRDRYNTAVRERMAEILRSAFGASAVDFTARLTESVLARLHFTARMAPGVNAAGVSHRALEAKLVEATRTWGEDLADAVRSDAGEEAGGHLMDRWIQGIPEGFKEDVAPRAAVADLLRLETVLSGEVDLGLSMYEPLGAEPGYRRLKLYRNQPLSLSHVTPYLAHLGVEVIDERPYTLSADDGQVAHIYDFGLRYPLDALPAGRDLEAARTQFAEAFLAAWRGQCESDGFQRLVVLGGLTWRQVVIVRAYVKYLRQTGITFSQEYIENTLATHVDITRDLVHLFETRFDPAAGLGEEPAGPDAGDIRRARVAEISAAILSSLDAVASLDHDRILRAILRSILATLRTNAYRQGRDGHPLPYLSLKVDPAMVPDLPKPIPAFEVFVYSPTVEGVHLRFGPIARGGLRWSDRPEDFRTEVLGLVKAQMVKNAVIVPTGAKGCFFPKNLPDPAQDREAWLATAIAGYRTFISGLLDITDNLLLDPDGATASVVVPPPGVIRYDQDDPYLVVAADKGTATFSDIANEVAASYGFWLGDAFASGGSVGYDHKAMGITAKGAWEAVRRHFREMGRNIQTQDTTVVGIGDMSGDVFGNGMLLSRHLRLVAAFDHRHIFVDPDPDPEVSFTERERLFALPRSSWADYDEKLISAGGGVFPRSAKSIPVSPQMAKALGLEGVQALTPAELQRAILCAPVDLLWNGGIGTYVKSATQTHAEVGDKANDTIRVNGRDLRAKVVGEGGNLGLTQLGRVEAAQHGVRVNTDAIDNSAGVDCSDHEVNIKILVDGVVAAGDLTAKQRVELLSDMTAEVAQLVLRDNYEQNVLLGNARVQSHPMLTVHQRFIRSLEAKGQLDRALEFLPDDAEIAHRNEQGLGLTSPEFAVLVAYAKLTLADEVAASSLPDDPWLEHTLRRYFPSQLQERFAEQIARHPLRRNIITSALVNELINRGGITFAFRAAEETGAGADQVARAFMICREVFNLTGFVRAVEELDDVVPTSAQTLLYLEFRRLLDRAVRWFLQNRPGALDVGAEITRFAATMAELTPVLPGLLIGSEREGYLAQVESMEAAGVGREMAERGAGLLILFMGLDITTIAQASGVPALDVAKVYLRLSEHYGVDALLRRITSLPRPDRWQSLARASLRYDLYAALESLTTAVLTHARGEVSDPEAAISAWEATMSASVQAARATLEEVGRLEAADLASLSVALRSLRHVVRSGAEEF